jgi:murein DD-endopeptidase MepM/ murein hydrolase activator NlpD
VALRPVQLFGFVLAAALVAVPAHAEDSRIDKAKKVRDEILEKRRGQLAGVAARPDLPVESDPFLASTAAARERLAAIDAQIEEKRRASGQSAAPREKLQAKSDELALQVNAIQEQNRARVEAIYRSAKLGAGAAGWHPEPARSARLSRYLASVAEVQQKKLELVEIEHGSIIAALDKVRADDASVRAELHALDADRTEALASLERAMADAGMPRMANAGASRMAGLTPEEAEAEALAQEHAAALSGSPEPSRDAAADSALAVERAMALLKAKTGIKPVGEIAVAKTGEEPGPTATGGLPATGAGEPGEGAANGDFTWPSPVGTVAAKADAAAKAEAEAEEKARAEEAALAARAAEAEKVVMAAAKAEADKAAAKAAEEKAAAELARAKADEVKAAEEARAAELARAAKEEAHGTSGELEDGPAVLAPSPAPAGEPVASVPAQPGGEAPTDADAAATEAEKNKRPNLLSRMFGGGDRESDAFASSRGSLPPPVAGKVVANYGQQHKSGATYRGVILRAGHSAPIKAVAGGKVSFAGNVPGLGNTVIVSHGGRYHTVYARLGSLEVKEGESVGGGTEIGTLPADNADMHFELRDQGKAIDPVPWLKGGVPGAAAQ